MPVFVLGSCKPTSSLGVLPVPAPTPALRSTLARLKYQPQSPEPAVCPAHPQLEASPPEAMAVWSFSTRGRPLVGCLRTAVFVQLSVPAPTPASGLCSARASTCQATSSHAFHTWSGINGAAHAWSGTAGSC